MVVCDPQGASAFLTHPVAVHSGADMGHTRRETLRCFFPAGVSFLEWVPLFLGGQKGNHLHNYFSGVGGSGVQPLSNTGHPQGKPPGKRLFVSRFFFGGGVRFLFKDVPLMTTSKTTLHFGGWRSPPKRQQRAIAWGGWMEKTSQEEKHVGTDLTKEAPKPEEQKS